MWVAASALYSLRFHGAARFIVLGLAMVVGTSAFGAWTLLRRRTSLALQDGQLLFSGLLGIRALKVHTHASRVVRAEVLWGGVTERSSRLWMIVEEAERVKLGLNLAAWDEAALEALRERVELPLEIDDVPKRPAKLVTAWPGSIPWWAVHPVLATLLAIAVVAVLVLLS